MKDPNLKARLIVSGNLPQDLAGKFNYVRTAEMHFRENIAINAVKKLSKADCRLANFFTSLSTHLHM